MVELIHYDTLQWGDHKISLTFSREFPFFYWSGRWTRLEHKFSPVSTVITDDDKLVILFTKEETQTLYIVSGIKSYVVKLVTVEILENSKNS